MGRRGPTSLSNYLTVHESQMTALLAEGFVVENDCAFDFPPRANFFVLSGAIHCLGNITLSVTKVIGFTKGSGMTGLVKTTDCSYNACIAQECNIFRYDYPHLDHRASYHKHVFDPFDEGREMEILDLGHEDAFPTLAEVLRELHDWYDKNADRLTNL